MASHFLSMIASRLTAAARPSQLEMVPYLPSRAKVKVAGSSFSSRSLGLINRSR